MLEGGRRNSGNRTEMPNPQRARSCPGHARLQLISASFVFKHSSKTGFVRGTADSIYKSDKSCKSTLRAARGRSTKQSLGISKTCDEGCEIVRPFFLLFVSFHPPSLQR